MLYKDYLSVFRNENSLLSAPSQGCSIARSQRGTLLFAASRGALSALAVLFRDPQRDRKDPLEVDIVFIYLLLSAFVFYCSPGANRTA